MLEVVLDTETTGLSVKDGHRIVEIGCIELNNLIPTSKKFHCYLNPEKKVSEKALEVHGYTDEFLSTKQKFKEIVDEFLNFIENKKLVIHNAEFDLGHLNNELSLLGKNNINKSNVIDTLELARDKFPGSSISLNALCKRYRIDNSKRTQHTALVDCELLSKVYINLIDQKEPTLDFQGQENDKLNLSISNNNLYFKKVIEPTPEEFQLHKKYNDLPKEIIFAGKIKHNLLPDWYRTADIYLFYSLLENCSNTVLEALATRLPVLCTNLAGTKELIKLTNGGIVVEADKKLDLEKGNFLEPPPPDQKKILEGINTIVKYKNKISDNINTKLIDINFIAQKYHDFIKKLEL